MANINLQALFDQKNRQFKGGGLTRFQLDFIDATNRALTQITAKARPDDPIARISNVNEDVDLDTKFEHVLSNGITLEMLRLGQESAVEIDMGELSRLFDDGCYQIFYTKYTTLQVADPDSNTTDIIGLGATG